MAIPFGQEHAPQAEARQLQGSFSCKEAEPVLAPLDRNSERDSEKEAEAAGPAELSDPQGTEGSHDRLGAVCKGQGSKASEDAG